MQHLAGLAHKHFYGPSGKRERQMPPEGAVPTRLLQAGCSLVHHHGEI